MPNHIQNRVRLTGEQSRIDELLKTVRDDEEDLGSIDFNKIIACFASNRRGLPGTPIAFKAGDTARQIV